jgi:hypothetical protein
LNHTIPRERRTRNSQLRKWMRWCTPLRAAQVIGSQHRHDAMLRALTRCRD